MDPATLARLVLLAAILALSAPNDTTWPAVTSNAASGTDVSATGASLTRLYIVQPGDTLSALALRFNTTVEQLERANRLTDPHTLQVGQRLVIPDVGAVRQSADTGASPTRLYIVQPGDTLAAIAAQFGVTVEELARLNGIENVNLLAVGQRLLIPQTANAVPIPATLKIMPSLVRQGQTMILRLTAREIVSATGRLDEQELHFVADEEGLWALAGISRCANYLGEYPVKLTVHDAQGDSKPLSFTLRVHATSFPLANLTLTPQMNALLDPAIIQAEDRLVNERVKPVTLQKFWQGAFRSPLAVENPRVSSRFGERRSYNGGKPGLCGHEGQDFAVAGGTPVYAPAGGIIALATTLKVRGKVVLIDHGLGVYSGFYHLNTIAVRQGQRVAPGDLIGRVGTTGFSTGDHLHWSMWVNGVYVDPMQWMQQEIP